MSADRLRRGEFVLLAGLLALFASLFLKWFSIDRVDSNSRGVVVSVFGSASTGWAYLGPFWVLLLVVTAGAGLAAVVLAARAGAGRPTYGAVSAVVLGTFVSWLVLLLLLVRVLLARPTPSANDLGSDAIVSAQATTGSLVDLGRAQAHLGLATGAWIGLLGLLLLAVGFWTAVADDRTDAAESAVPPPPASPIPPLKPAPEPAAEPEITEAEPVAGSGPADVPEPVAEPDVTDAPVPAAEPRQATPPPRTFRAPGALGPDDAPPPPAEDR